MAQLQSSIDSMTVVGDSIGRQYYREVAEGNFRPSYGLTKEDTVKIEKADIHEYNVDSLYEVASLTQKQKVLSSAVSRADNCLMHRSKWQISYWTFLQPTLPAFH